MGANASRNSSVNVDNANVGNNVNGGQSLAEKDLYATQSDVSSQPGLLRKRQPFDMQHVMRAKNDKKSDRWYMEDVTTTSHEPRHRRCSTRFSDKTTQAAAGTTAQLRANDQIGSIGEGRGRGGGRGGGGTVAAERSTASQPPLCVNTPQNVALLMEKFDSDVRQLLPYCFDAAGEPEFSIALCFVSRLTMQDRAASQRFDCKYFPRFQTSQRAFYFRLVPVGEQNDRLFVVEYYDSPLYEVPTLVFNTHGWIQFEALLRLFFHQGYRYLMKLFPESSPLCGGDMANSICTTTAQSPAFFSHRVELRNEPNFNSTLKRDERVEAYEDKRAHEQAYQRQQREEQGEEQRDEQGEEDDDENDENNENDAYDDSDSSDSDGINKDGNIDLRSSSAQTAFSVSIPVRDYATFGKHGARNFAAEQSVW